MLKRREYVGAIFKAFEKRGRIELKELRYAGLAMKFRSDWAELSEIWESLGPWQPPPQTSFVLEPPYDDEAILTEAFSAVFAASGYHDANTGGGIQLHAGAVDGGYQMARGQVGGFLTIPSGFSTLKLQARITNVSAEVIAFALGASWASSGGIVEVTPLTNSGVTRHETSINYVVAPLLF